MPSGVVIWIVCPMFATVAPRRRAAEALSPASNCRGSGYLGLQEALFRDNIRRPESLTWCSGIGGAMITPAPDSSPGIPGRRDVRIEAHGERVVPWRQSQKGGQREDRMLRQVTVSLPPRISDYSPDLPPSVAAQTDKALTAITRLDSTHGQHLASLAVLLLRAESVASSKIEHVEASMEDFARASHGTKSNASATSMVASAEALASLISSVDDGGPISLDNILDAHC